MLWLEHIVRRQRPPDPLQLELTDRLDLDDVLDLHQHPRTDEDLTRLGFIAKRRGDIRHCTDGGIVEASLEANGAERSETVRNANAKANLVPEAASRCCQSSDGVTQFKGHQHGASARTGGVLCVATKYIPSVNFSVAVSEVQIAATSIKSGLFETIQHMVVRCLRAEL